jgi:hypothetical protein
MSQVNRPFGVEERSPSFLNEYAPSLSEFDYPSLFPDKEVKPVRFFKFGDLFAERSLADSQYLGGPREVQLFGQNDRGVQMARINVGEHRSDPRSRILSHQELRAAICS